MLVLLAFLSLLSCLVTYTFYRVCQSFGWCVDKNANETYARSKVVYTSAFLPVFFVFLSQILLGAIFDPLLYYWCFGGALLLLGFLDDRFFIPASIRLFLQFITVICVLGGIGYVDRFMPFGYLVELGWLGFALTTLGFLWTINWFNFIDGIDGFLVTQVISILLFLSVMLWLKGDGFDHVFVCILGLVACLLGFYVWNIAPAKVFLGDTGSLFLGFSIAFLVIYLHQKAFLPLWSMLILLLYSFLDTSWLMMVRLFQGKGIFSRHSDHFFKRLAFACGSHNKSIVFGLLINSVILFPLSLVALFFPHYGMGIFFCALFVLWLVLFVGVYPRIKA